MRTPALRDLQAAFWRSLAGEPDPDLIRIVRSGGALSPTERVGVYAGMYLARIVEALAEDFPKLAAELGADAFADLVRDYVGRHPSTEPSIRHIGRALPAFVADRDPPWLGDVARLEWARLEVFDAPDVPPIGVDDLRRVPAADWPDLRFALVPACVRLATAWSVQRLWAEPPAPPVAGRTALRVWRDDFLVYQAPMSAAEEATLARVAAGDTFAGMCEVFDDAADAGALLLRWLEDGILAWRA